MPHYALNVDNIEQSHALCITSSMETNYRFIYNGRYIDHTIIIVDQTVPKKIEHNQWP